MRRLFTASAARLVVLTLAHATSFLVKRVPADDAEKQLLDLTADYKLNPVGSARSMADLMRGFSISFRLAALGFGVIDFALCR